ncbi:uncharacterized protein AB675_6040 [Cyphellophora attinorum]|uniref:FAD dependent oxidoreductase domain-containing protein n=1 Tax=Cyphellophora attinorum TaxID=1664694 RepID=A0A0N1H6I4_9EURO|nr:uncharacterized protein AB675_6040 [Phialophora attinorum]KPI36975.1 hypothetical protein AB675_6040 [Phialophora attinorum]
MAPHSTSPPPPSLSTTSAKPLIEPSLPQSEPCLSWWHQTTRAFPYLNANNDKPVPSSTKYLIIGSGISGALTAYTLVHDYNVPGDEIVILEAREAVSGASGRNAGHVRPDAFRGFQGYEALHGAEQALKIIANEKLVFEKIDAFVKQHEVPCDFHPTTTFDVCLTEEFAKYEKDSFDAYVRAGGDVSHIKYFEGEEARQRTRVSGAVAAYEWPAGSSHPAKLAQWLLSKSINRGVQLYTHCPAIETTSATPQLSSWATRTPRGTITSPKIIHCTNAYASILLPQLSSFLTPNKAQAHALIPDSAFSGANTLSSTMSLRYSIRHFYSLIQRQSDGTMILGVSRSNPELSASTKSEIVSFNDTAFNSEIVEDALRQFDKMLPPPAPSSKPTTHRHGESLAHAWTGIIGMTPDNTPLVGAIPELPGQYICAASTAMGWRGSGLVRRGWSS